MGEWAVVVTGVVRWFDPDRRLGLLSRDTGGDLLVHGSALPPGMVLVKGARVEFTVDDHPRGPRAGAVTVLDYPTPRTRKTPHEMVTLLEDLIRVLDRTSDGYRHHRRPAPAETATLTTVLRTVADDLDS